MATLRLSYAQSDYDQVLSGEASMTIFLGKILKSEPAFSKIIDHLSAYHRPDGGSIEINNFEITDASYNTETNKGQVKISYRIYYFYGCADITKDAGDHETWNFDIDTTGSTLILYMPEYEQRSTADEF
jgi:hypothetical protein